jgi:phage nucleotide-binding protein
MNGAKVLVYGASGSGKTTLIKTLPNPIILSAESGLLSLSDMELPYIEISTIEDLYEAYQWVLGEDGNGFDSIALDSISEIAEVVLSAEKKVAKDPRQAYGATAEKLTDLIRAFRDIPGKNVFMTAKLEKATDEQGRLLYYPSMPGNKLGQALPYFFDDVFAMRAEKDEEGNTQRFLQTENDGLWMAKARTSSVKKLEAYELPDLGAIIEKLV